MSQGDGIPNNGDRTGTDAGKFWSVRIQWLLTGIVFTIIALWLLAPGLFSPTGVDIELPDLRESATQKTDNTLFIRIGDVNYLNRIFSELDNEVAYCVGFDEQNMLSIRLADTVSATQDSVEFSIANCPMDEYDMFGVLHTHPSGNLNPSEDDVTAIREADYQVLCIQSGEIIEEPTRRTRALACYVNLGNQSGSGELKRVPVVTVQ